LVYTAEHRRVTSTNEVSDQNVIILPKKIRTLDLFLEISKELATKQEESSKQIQEYEEN
jgi:hypothetical protein